MYGVDDTIKVKARFDCIFEALAGMRLYFLCRGLRLAYARWCKREIHSWISAFKREHNGANPTAEQLYELLVAFGIDFLVDGAHIP